jgi:hypothetical protein
MAFSFLSLYSKKLCNSEKADGNKLESECSYITGDEGVFVQPAFGKLAGSLSRPPQARNHVLHQNLIELKFTATTFASLYIRLKASRLLTGVE